MNAYCLVVEKVWQGGNLANLVRSAKLINHQLDAHTSIVLSISDCQILILAKVTHHIVYHMYIYESES